MNEFKVIVIMNETMIEVLKEKNVNYDQNIKIGQYLENEDQKVLIDVDERKIRPFDDSEFSQKRPVFIQYNELNRGGYDYYDGR